VSGAPPKELHLLLDDAGAIVAFQEQGASWMGMLAFSSEDKARDFMRASGLKASEMVTIDSKDDDAVAQLLRSVKRRAIRNMLLDLDYQTGRHVQVEFEGERLGEASERQFHHHH
jgi:hypothetical protein